MSFIASIRQAWQTDKVPFYFIIAAAVVLIFFTFSRHRMTTNTRSRIITVERMLEANTLAHKTPNDSTPYELSMDMVKVGENFYSSKPPIYPMIMVVQAFPVHKLQGGTFKEHDRTYLRYLTLLNQVFPYVLMLLVALVLIRRYTEDKWTVRFLILALSFGSLAFGYAVTINNHTPAAVIWVVVLFLLVRIREEKSEAKLSTGKDKAAQWNRFFWVGALCGLGVMIDLTSVFFGGFFMLLAVLLDWKKALLAIVAGVVPVVISLWFYHEMSGSVVPYYFRHGLYHYEGSPWDHREGIDALKEPKWLYLINSLFTHHGLFSLSPVLALGVVGIFNKSKWQGERVRWIWLVLGLCMALVVAAITRNTANYGGYCVGMRWFIPFMPLLMLAGIPVVEALGKKTWGKVLCGVLLAVSILPNLEILYWEAFIQGSLEKWWYLAFGRPW